LVEILLVAAIIILAVLAVELKKLLHAVISLCGMCILIGILFGLLRAMYVMVFQLLIYAGATIVLFISVIMLAVGDEK